MSRKFWKSHKNPPKSRGCVVCGGFPVNRDFGMCSPCVTGEAATAGTLLDVRHTGRPAGVAKKEPKR